MTNAPAPKSVEAYLNATDYSVDGAYVPSDFALEFVTFIKLVNGKQGEEHLTPLVHYQMLDTLTHRGDRLINLCHRGIAKALSLDTKLPTPLGWRTVANIQVGDFIYGEDGLAAPVLAKSEVFHKPMYQLTLADGRKLKVSEDHINTVVHQRQRRVNGVRVNYLDRRDLTTQELLQINLTTTRSKTAKNPKGKENRLWFPLPQPVQYPEQVLPIDPYTLGLMIGDGAMCHATGYTRLHGHVDDLPKLVAHIPTRYGEMLLDKRFPSVGRVGLYALGPKIMALGLNCHGNNKFVPDVYKVASLEQRLALLQGLMDTDGTAYKEGCCAFTSNSLQLAQDVRELVWSLGGVANIQPMNAAYRCSISLNMSLFRLPRKLERQHMKCLNRIPLVSIEAIPQEPSQCLSVGTPLHTFLAGDYVVTHNTTLMGEYLFLYIATYGEIPGFGKVSLSLYVSDSIENGVKNMRKNLEFRWENSDFLKMYIPQTRFTDIRWEFTNADGNVFIVKGYGAKTGVRGAKELGTRPQLAVLDDLISDEDARSATVISAVEDTVYKAVDYALHPTKNLIIWSGTPFNAKDPLYKAVESGAWGVNVFPVCESFPCTRAEFKGSWPDRFTYDYVKNKYDKAILSGKLETFNQELMLRIMSDEDRMIQDSDINWYKLDSVLKNKERFNFYITTDFATSVKQSSDFSVISVWAYNNVGDWLWVDGICKRQLMDANINDLFRLCQTYKPQSVGIEVTGQQGGFIQWIQGQMLERNIYFALASEGNDSKPGIRPNTNKMVRFNTVVPWFKARKMYFPLEKKLEVPMQEAMNELGLISASGFRSKHDDFIDTVSMLSSLTPWKPSEEAPLKQSSGASDMWEIETNDRVTDRMASYIV
jgi:predicted phage terminase large subunit-like protein